MARLIVLDASVVIAALSADDEHHDAAAGALADASDADLVLAATTRAEILVGPARAGSEKKLAAARDFADGCETVPISAEIADDAAALKARHRGLGLPDAIALVVAELIDADAVWTFDRRWREVHRRVVIP